MGLEDPFRRSVELHCRPVWDFSDSFSTHLGEERKGGGVSSWDAVPSSRSWLGWAGSSRGYLVGAAGTEGAAGATSGAIVPASCARSMPLLR
jgi:hypothetical protein